MAAVRFAKKHWTLVRVAIVALMLGMVALGAIGKGKGYKSRVMAMLGLADKKELPRVTFLRPAAGQVNVLSDAVITGRIKAPNGKINPQTFVSPNVMLTREGSLTPLPATFAISELDAAAGRHTFTITPAAPLEPNMRYTVRVTAGVKDAKALGCFPFEATFATGTWADPSIRFERIPQPTARNLGTGFTCVAMGPDGRLWAGLDDGRILRYPVSPDGTLGDPQVIRSLIEASAGPRLLIGFAFEPNADPECAGNAIYATHGAATFDNAPDFSGKVTRLSGPALETVEDVVIHLPRSVRDHTTNQPSFGPDGALYIPQPSNTAYGAADPIWGMRPERLLNAAILRLDVDKVIPGKPIDALTIDGGGRYDPRTPGAPLTIYAEGVRLAYDLCWHSNGRLYVPTNGSDAGGNTPAGNGAPALKAVADPEHDWLFKITPGEPVKYFGHPNPLQGHFIVNGGNPTPGPDFAEVTQYPVGTKPDANWQPAAYDFGNHISPNGVIEYRGGAFGGKLKGMLLICRYNGGSDLICIGLDSHGDVQKALVGIPGFTGLRNPLDVTEDTRTGNLYVSEYGTQSISLLRPIQSSAR